MPFFSPVFPLSRYLQRLPSLSDTCFPAIDGRNRGKDKRYILVHSSGVSGCRDFFNPLTYLDYLLLFEIDIATNSIPFWEDINGRLQRNELGEISRNFRISAATRIIKRDIRLQVKFEARIVNRDVKNESRIN